MPRQERITLGRQPLKPKAIKLRWARAFGLTFIFAWAVYTLIVTGNAVLNQVYRPLLRISPAANQYYAGDPFVRTIMDLSRSSTGDSRVLLVWHPDGETLDSSNTAFWYGVTQATFWLYPHKVMATSLPQSRFSEESDTIIEVRTHGQPAWDPPTGFQLTWVHDFPGESLATGAPPGTRPAGITVTSYRRPHG